MLFLLADILNPIAAICSLTACALMMLRRHTVKGTKIRAVTGTWIIILGVVVIVGATLRTIELLEMNRFLAAGIDTFSVIGWVLIVKYFLFDDDNWFSGQYRKLKKKLRNLRTRLSQIKLPSLMPSPVPA